MRVCICVYSHVQRLENERDRREGGREALCRDRVFTTINLLPIRSAYSHVSLKASAYRAKQIVPPIGISPVMGLFYYFYFYLFFFGDIPPEIALFQDAAASDRSPRVRLNRSARSERKHPIFVVYPITIEPTPIIIVAHRLVRRPPFSRVAHIVIRGGGGEAKYTVFRIYQTRNTRKHEMRFKFLSRAYRPKSVRKKSRML